MECRGFSGFYGDEEYCCLRDLDRYYKGDAFLLDRLEPIAFNSEGKLKKYMPCREYIRRTFDKPMGLPDYNNEAKNLFLSAAKKSDKNEKAEALILAANACIKLKEYRNAKELLNQALSEAEDERLRMKCRELILKLKDF